MPSPVGHALGGLAAGWLVEKLARVRTSPVSWLAALYMGVGLLPDLDLLVGTHSGPTHGLGSALIVGLTALAATRRFALALALAAAYASHTLLDWLGTDTTPPIGIMALWPLGREYYESDAHLFTAISRRYWLPGFWAHNFQAVLREVSMLLPALLLVAAWRATSASAAFPALAYRRRGAPPPRA
jgi:hypothetical protein